MLRQRGVTLVELMIALAIGMVVSLALTMVFTASMKARDDVSRFGEQIENGRFAISYLSQELGLAGMWDALEVVSVTAPAAMPNPCAVAVDDLKTAVPVSVQGYDTYTGGVDCIRDVRAKTDVIVLRRAATCSGTTGCTTTGPFFLSALCTPPVPGSTLPDTAELASLDPYNWYDVKASASGLTLHERDCKTVATSSIRRYIVRIFYIANNTDGTDGIPALKMVELSGSTFNTTAPTVVASGIEQMQIEYGSDTNSDGAPDAYSDTPPTTPLLARDVVGLKVHLLARGLTSDPETTSTGTRTYTLGNTTYPDAQGDALTGNNYRRQVFSTTIKLINPAVSKGG